MRYYLPCASLFLLGAVVAQTPQDNTVKDTAKAKAEEINKALLKGDFGKIIDLTHPKVVEMLGGREKAIAGMERELKQMKEKGITFQSGKVDAPMEPVEGSDGLYIVVPFTVEMKMPGGKAVGASFLIGASPDKGKTWRFIDGNIDIKRIKQVLPSLPDKLNLPERQKPVFVKDEN